MAAQGLAGLDADKMKLVQDLEIEMMTDMYARLTSACHKKCIPPKVSCNYFLYDYFKDNEMISIHSIYKLLYFYYLVS